MRRRMVWQKEAFRNSLADVSERLSVDKRLSVGLLLPANY